MSANDSQDSRIADRARPTGEADELRSGAGAASAMERVKSEHLMRRKHQHGIFMAAGYEEDQAPQH